VEYLKYTFTDLLISSFQIGGTEIIPTEEISLTVRRSNGLQRAEGGRDPERRDLDEVQPQDAVERLGGRTTIHEFREL